ncbi:galactokinase family protein [Bengtsoniella intestinalis]|uniref:galactokinase n=1 Tax=Bengtsoniella intestinalis TaxID=3073143 RepID=UPI00391EEC1E
MNSNPTLTQQLEAGQLNSILTTLYGEANLAQSTTRAMDVCASYTKTFGAEPTALFSAPGRTELGGNHTDHQHGCVLAAAVNLDILCAVTPNQSGMIRVQSQGYPLIVVDLHDLTPKVEEVNTSAALIRGVAARFATLGCNLQNAGLDAYMVSDVLGGSGLSSSAAFEVLIGTMVNSLFHNNQCSAVEIAQIGQYAENMFFGKPCGLMDQTASSVGSVVSIDFNDTTNPIVEQVPLDFAATGHALCILDSGADHADLTDEYASITNELKAVCQVFGKDYLRQIPEADFWAKLPQVRKAAGDRGALRAIHFYGDSVRAQNQAKALHDGDFDSFLAMVHASGLSSAQHLQNVVPTGATFNQELMITLALCEEILQGRGAVRVHGGGFGGTAQAFVPVDMLDEFKTKTEAVLGSGNCHILSIRPLGGVRLA